MIRKDYFVNVSRAAVTFASAQFHRFPTLIEILSGKTLENSGKQNPKMRFKSPYRARSPA